MKIAKWFPFKLFTTARQHEPCSTCITPELLSMRQDMQKIHEKIDRLVATVNGDEEWFLKLNRGADHDRC